MTLSDLFYKQAQRLSTKYEFFFHISHLDFAIAEYH